MRNYFLRTLDDALKFDRTAFDRSALLLTERRSAGGRLRAKGTRRGRGSQCSHSERTAGYRGQVAKTARVGGSRAPDSHIRAGVSHTRQAKEGHTHTHSRGGADGEERARGHTHGKGTKLGAEGGAYLFHRLQQGTDRERGGGSSAGVKNLRHHAQGDPDRQPQPRRSVS